MLGQTANDNLLIFRSNVTPEITIDLASLLKPGDPSKDAVQGKSRLALNLIKPEIIFSALNFKKTIAPYGSPEEGAWKYALALMGLAGMLGAGLTFSYCTKSASYALASIGITTLLVAELIYARQQV